MQDYREIYAWWRDEKPSIPCAIQGGTWPTEIYLCPGSKGLSVEVRLTGPDTRPEFYVLDPNHNSVREATQGDFRAYCV